MKIVAGLKGFKMPKPNKYSKLNKNINVISSQPLISVIMPTYNRKWLVGRSINSLLTQSYKNIEIVLVNDAGEDVQEVVDQFHDPRIKYFQNEKNLDLAGTRNVALHHVTGNYICLLDDDDIHLPYTLEFRMYMINKLGADVVYSRALQDMWRPQPNVKHGYVSIHKQLYWDSPFDLDLILVQNIAPCCCPLFSRKSWEKTMHWFDESLTTSEDWAFWVELSRNNIFYELKIIDCECSIREDKTQMTGSREGYNTHLPYLYKKWRPYAKNLDWVIEHQRQAIRAKGLVPEMLGL